MFYALSSRNVETKRVRTELFFNNVAGKGHNRERCLPYFQFLYPFDVITYTYDVCVEYERNVETQRGVSHHIRTFSVNCNARVNATTVCHTPYTGNAPYMYQRVSINHSRCKFCVFCTEVALKCSTTFLFATLI